MGKHMVPLCIGQSSIFLVVALLAFKVFTNNIWGRISMSTNNRQRSKNGLYAKPHGKNYIFRPFKHINIK